MATKISRKVSSPIDNKFFFIFGIYGLVVLRLDGNFGESFQHFRFGDGLVGFHEYRPNFFQSLTPLWQASLRFNLGTVGKPVDEGIGGVIGASRALTARVFDSLQCFARRSEILGMRFILPLSGLFIQKFLRVDTE